VSGSGTGTQNTNINIKDVARRAGVSISTVSRVMNGTAVVAPETRRRVEAAIRELNYRPSAIARQLAMRSRTAIGLILPQLDNPVFTMIADGVENAARLQGLSVVLCNTDSTGAEEEVYLDLLTRMRVAGILVVSGEFGRGSGSEELYRPLAGRTPLVFIGPSAGELRVDTVSVDEEEAGYLAARHLVELGHRRIGFIGGGREYVVTRRKLAGLERALGEAGLEPDPGLYALRGFDYEDGRTAFGQLARGTLPTGIVCGSDILAMAVVQDAGQMKLRVPQDISVVGFDDIPFASYISPPLTTVAQPLREIGTLAVEALGRLMEDPAKEAEVRLVEPRLVVRKSTAPPGGW
jgi:LacI family transcriptional regulator